LGPFYIEELPVDSLPDVEEHITHFEEGFVTLAPFGSLPGSNPFWASPHTQGTFFFINA